MSIIIVWIPHPFFKGEGEVNFWSPSLEGGGGNLKNWKKGVEVWCRHRSSQKDGGQADTFSILFFQGLSFLHLEIMLCMKKRN